MFSRRSALIALASTTALAACTPRGRMALVDTQTPGASVYPVFVASNRPLDPNNYAAVGRHKSMNYSRYDVSIPPEREPGRIQWPSATPDPSEEFVPTQAGRFRDEAAFVANLRAELARLPAGRRGRPARLPQSTGTPRPLTPASRSRRPRPRRSAVCPWLQHEPRRRGVPAGADGPRSGRSGRAGLLFVADRRKSCRICLRP